MLRFLFSKLRNDTVLQHRKNVWYTSLLNQSVYKKCNYIGGVHRWCWILSFSCFFVNIFSKSLRGPPLPSIKKRVKGSMKTRLYNIKRNMENYHAPQSPCIWESGGEYCRGLWFLKEKGSLWLLPFGGPKKCPFIEKCDWIWKNMKPRKNFQISFLYR